MLRKRDELAFFRGLSFTILVEVAAVVAIWLIWKGTR